MPEINWAFLCDYAYVDSSGKASIIGTFDYMNFKQLPANWPQLFLAVGITIHPGERFNLSALLSAPSGHEIGRTSITGVNIPAAAQEPQKGVITFAFYNQTFAEVGEHRIELFIDDLSIHSIPLNVRLVG